MENIIIKYQETAARWKLVLSSLLLVLPGFTGGAAISYAAVALPFYLDPDNSSGLVMSKDQASWFVSLNAPMQMVGNLLSGYFMDKFGRKMTLIGSSMVVILASAILSFAPSYEILLLGCLLNGSAVGTVRPTIGLYLSEISLVKWRGALSSLNVVTNNAGYLYGIMVGSLFHISIFPWVMVGPSLIFLIFSWCLVDTPLWYMKVGRTADASHALLWLRGSEYKIQPELKELEDLLCSNGDKVDKFALLTKKSFILPVCILSVLFSVHASVGADPLSYYALTLFIFPGVSLSPSVIAVFFQLSFTVGMLATALLPEVNRRPQFIFGCVSLCLHMLLFGIDNYLALSETISALNYLPVILLISFGFNFGLGIGTIPYTLTGEIFPQNLRTYGCAISVASRYVTQFILLKIFYSLVSVFGLSGMYWIQSTAAFFGGVFAFCLLPETRNKTFTELEKIFEGENEENKEKFVDDV